MIATNLDFQKDRFAINVYDKLNNSIKYNFDFKKITNQYDTDS